MADEEAEGGAGNWALKGFDYQVDVSVWLALDLMVAARLTHEMTLEHVSEEDVEADVEEFAPETVAEAVPMRGYRLIVQAKRRTGDAWTEARFITLLKHGEKRKSAQQRLEEDPDARYLLVTSAALNGPVRNLGVRRAGQWPAAGKSSANIAAVGTNVAGRVAVIGNEDDERLETDIRSLLVERFKVPNACWLECLTALRTAARARMVGAAGGRWSRDEVERLLLEHDGYLVAAPELESYVRPTNWGDLKQALATRHAVMIVGQSGSGKTMTSDALWQELRGEIEGLQRVHITHGPDQLRADTTLPPVLYDIEDPWGRFRFEPQSRPWNDRLAEALSSGRHDRLFVATSRTDVASASGAADTITRWKVALDAENYGEPQRTALYRNLLAGLPPELRALAHRHERAVLAQLALPLEIRKFFDALPQLDLDLLPGGRPAAIAEAIRRAHRDSIERIVIDQIEARRAVKAAAILWALIKPHGRLSADVLRALEDPLGDAEAGLDESIVTLVDAFVTARNLRQSSDGSLGYYHGKVEAGIEAALARHPQAGRRALRTLIGALLARDEDTGDGWGIETAIDIMRLSDRIAGLRPELPRPAQDRIDSWLEGRMLSADGGLRDGIALAASVGSARSNLAELARWLMHRPEPGFPGMLRWGRPERDGEWYHRLRSDANVRTVLDAFVRTVLPDDRIDYPKSLATKMEPLAGELTNAFLEAARKTVAEGVMRNDDAISNGALKDLDGFEGVVDAAIEALRPTEAQMQQAARDNLAIVNAEVPDDYAEHLAANEDGYTAKQYLAAFAERLRAERGWRAVAGHRHMTFLRANWLELIASAREVDPDEPREAVDLGYGTDDEQHLWPALSAHWMPEFVGLLERRIREGSPLQSVRMAALDCLIDHSPDMLEAVATDLAAGQGEARMAELSLDLACRVLRPYPKEAGRGAVAEALIDRLPDRFREFAEARVALGLERSPDISIEAAQAMARIADPSEPVRHARVRIAKHVAIDVADDVRWLLDRSNEWDAALHAIEAAVARGLDEVILGALDHRFAHAAARALTGVADPLPAPLPKFILERSRRESSPVREALLEQLRAKPHQAHLEALMVLSTDEWSRWSRQGTDDGDFMIARGAIEAIAELPTVADSTLGTLIERARTTEDLSLMRMMLACVLKHGGPTRQAEVVDMARRGNRLAVGEAAAGALLEEHEVLEDGVVGSITLGMITAHPAAIAGSLLMVAGLRSSDEMVDAIAKALSSSSSRRLFLALLARSLTDRDPVRAASVAALLPDAHPARAWAEGSEDPVDEDALIDLGDEPVVRETYSWMPKPPPAESPFDALDMD